MMMLADHFLADLRRKTRSSAPRPAANARNAIGLSISGNVRELEGEWLVWWQCARREEISASALNDRHRPRKPATQKGADIQPMSLAGMGEEN